MTHPNKRHNGWRLTLIALPNCLDAGKAATGIYRHHPRSSSFGFELAPGQVAVFSRDEWRVETVHCA